MPPVPKPPTAKASRNRRLVIAIAAAGLVAVALIVGSIVFTRGSGNDAVAPTGAAPTDTAPTDTTHAGVALIAGIPQKGTVLGNPQAAVRMFQFEDLQCPICKKYTDDAFPAIVEEYVKPGRVKIDFRGLAFLGADSDKALRIVIASGFQNKLWEISYDAQTPPAEETVWKLAYGKTLPKTIDVTRETRCLSDPRHLCTPHAETQKYVYAPAPVSAYVRPEDMK